MGRNAWRAHQRQHMRYPMAKTMMALEAMEAAKRAAHRPTKRGPMVPPAAPACTERTPVRVVAPDCPWCPEQLDPHPATREVSDIPPLKVSLQDAWRSHQCRGVFRCSLCPDEQAVFSTTGGLVHHSMEEHADAGEYACMRCMYDGRSFSYGTFCAFSGHMGQHCSDV